jgi:hypothetical protein
MQIEINHRKNGFETKIGFDKNIARTYNVE